jgi:hypothetical protein
MLLDIRAASSASAPPSPTDTFLMLLLFGIFVGIFCRPRCSAGWCGWACLQTVYMEFVYAAERWIEGGRARQLASTPAGLTPGGSSPPFSSRSRPCRQHLSPTCRLGPVRLADDELAGEASCRLRGQGDDRADAVRLLLFP